MGIRLDQVNIVVRDMDAMGDFYGRLGLDLAGNRGPWAPHHRNAVTADGARIDLDSPAFAATWDEGWPGGPGIVLGFRVGSRDDVDRLHDELVAAGHASQQPPYDAFWGARYAVVTDPDGNAVGLMSPVDQARRTATPPLPASG